MRTSGQIERVRPGCCQEKASEIEYDEKYPASDEKTFTMSKYDNVKQTRDKSKGDILCEENTVIK